MLTWKEFIARQKSERMNQLLTYLAANRGSTKAAAIDAGYDRPNFIRLCRKHGIDTKKLREEISSNPK